MKKITIYTKSNCGFCTRAKDALEAAALSFREIDLDTSIVLRQALMDETGMSTVPLIFVGDMCIGGFTELSTLLVAGTFKELLNDEE